MGGCSMARSARRTSRTGASSAGKKPAAAARFGRLGDTGRYRTNVWDYAGISSIGASRADELSMHPTVKPVAMIADAIRDCSRRGEVVLDCFGGSDNLNRDTRWPKLSFAKDWPKSEP